MIRSPSLLCETRYALKFCEVLLFAHFSILGPTATLLLADCRESPRDS